MKLYSNRSGELPFCQQSPCAPRALLFPGADIQVAAAPDNRYYYLFQQFTIGPVTVRWCHFYSREKDTLTVITDQQPVTLRWATRYSHRFTTPSFGMQLFHERNFNCFYLPHQSLEYQLEAGVDCSFLDVLLPVDYLQSLAIPGDALEDFIAKVRGKLAAKLAPRRQIAPIELLRWIDELTEWMAAGDKCYAAGETIVHQLVKQGILRLTHWLCKTAIIEKQEEVNKIYKAATIIQASGDYYTNNKLKELAQQVELSVYSLKGVFQGIYGYPILKHQSEEKMRRALRLVETKRLSEKVVCDILRFSSEQCFSRTYKRRFGHAPYRLNSNG
jgi:AraC-like DNA-binding protein